MNENERDFYDLDKPSERFLGWLPHKPASIVFMIFNVLWILAAMFLWRYVPDFYWFGWMPSALVVYMFVYVPIGAIGWAIYYYKFWPELKEPEDEEEGGAK